MGKESNNDIIDYTADPIFGQLSTDDYLSNHTRLINIILNLAICTAKFPHPLYDLGYLLKKGCGIEVKIKLNGQGVTPDVLLINDKDNHILIFECKSKAIKNDQLMKYLTLKDNIVNAKRLRGFRPSHFTEELLAGQAINIDFPG